MLYEAQHIKASCLQIFVYFFGTVKYLLENAPADPDVIHVQNKIPFCLSRVCKVKVFLISMCLLEKLHLLNDCITQAFGPATKNI